MVAQDWKNECSQKPKAVLGSQIAVLPMDSLVKASMSNAQVREERTQTPSLNERSVNEFVALS